MWERLVDVAVWSFVLIACSLLVGVICNSAQAALLCFVLEIVALFLIIAHYIQLLAQPPPKEAQYQRCLHGVVEKEVREERGSMREKQRGEDWEHNI